MMTTGLMTTRRWLLGVAVAAGLSACGSRGPVLNDLGPDALYEMGEQAYEEEDWDRAILVFDQLAARYPTDTRIQDVRLRVADAYFAKEDYVIAASEYVRLATDYPTSEYADDARFRTCEAYYRLSPDPQLDQEYTRAALDHCQSLAAYYPQSEFTPKAREYTQDLFDKLAEKAYLNGDYYFKRHAYNSSIVYYEDVLEQYPESEYAPRALLRLVQVYQRLGYREEMEAARERLLRDFPDTAEAAEAREISLAVGR